MLIKIIDIVPEQCYVQKLELNGCPEVGCSANSFNYIIVWIQYGSSVPCIVIVAVSEYTPLSASITREVKVFPAPQTTGRKQVSDTFLYVQQKLTVVTANYPIMVSAWE